jgi:FkbM family methyltransferase
MNLSDQVVLYNGIYWPKTDTNGEQVTPTYAPKASTAFNLMHITGHTPALIANLITNRNVIVQAGGNAGYYPKLYSQWFNHVYTFEPDPLNFYCLSQNCNTPNVHKFQACLGSKNECVGVFNTTTQLGHGGSHVSGEGFIPTFKIDQLNLHDCNLIHLDIEGYEEHALRGAEETIKRFKPIIVIEYYAPWLNRYNSNIDIIDAFLHTLDYKFVSAIDASNDRVYKYVGA